MGQICSCLGDLRLPESHKTIKLSYPVGNCDRGIIQGKPCRNPFFIWLNHIRYATADLSGKTFLGHKRGLDWGLDYKNISILGAWHPYGKQASSWDPMWLWQESGSSQGVPRHKLTPVPFHLASKSAAICGKDVFALCKHPSFPPVLPFSNGNQSTSLLRPLFFVP